MKIYIGILIKTNLVTYNCIHKYCSSPWNPHQQQQHLAQTLQLLTLVQQNDKVMISDQIKNFFHPTAYSARIFLVVTSIQPACLACINSSSSQTSRVSRSTHPKTRPGHLHFMAFSASLIDHSIHYY